MNRYRCTACKLKKDVEKDPPMTVRTSHGFPIVVCIPCWEWSDITEGDLPIICDILLEDEEEELDVIEEFLI